MKIKLREIGTQPIVVNGQRGVILTDPLGISQKSLFVPDPFTLLLMLMDGTRDTRALTTGFELRTGSTLSNSMLEQFVSRLDDSLLLENERFTRACEVVLADYRSAASRPPVLAGKCYPADARELGRYLQRYFDQLGGEETGGQGEVKGLISPHIDFERGGHVYAEVWSRARAAVRETELFIILGTDHNEGEGRVTLTRQNYQTPWGLIPTAQDVVDDLAKEIGDSVFSCELNHREEHSVESALVWLHYLLGEKSCHILPVLCGSFQPFIDRGESPATASHIASTIEVLEEVCRQRRTIVVAAGDLAHTGPVFGDMVPTGLVGKNRMAKQDEKLLGIISSGSAEDCYAEILKEKDCRHVCGLPPIYIALSVLSGIAGKPAGYAQCPASNDGNSQVSICGMIF